MTNRGIKEERMLSEKLQKTPAPYGRYVLTACHHTLTILPRRKMTILAGVITAMPISIPILLVMNSSIWDPEGEAVFIRLAQFVYIGALCPLFALLFGTSLIGEDVENQTFPYLFTRPIPRSAWVLGRFLGYVIGTSAMLAGSMAVTFLACTQLSKFPLDGGTLALFGQFAGATLMSLAGYGAVCMFLGALVRHPVVIGILFMFLWQRLAVMVAGYVDFLTVEKYVSAMLPRREGLEDAWHRLISSLGVEPLVVDVGPWPAAFALAGISAGFVFLTAYVVVNREYSAARSASA